MKDKSGSASPMHKSLLKVALISFSFVLMAAKPPVVSPITEDMYLTLKDLDQIKVMFMGYIVGFACWLLKALYDMFIKKTDSADEKLEALMVELHALNGKVDRMNGRLEQFATKGEAQEMAQNAVTFYHDLQRRK